MPASGRHGVPVVLVERACEVYPFFVHLQDVPAARESPVGDHLTGFAAQVLLDPLDAASAAAWRMSGMPGSTSCL
jgi:hypothetical protein